MISSRPLIKDENILDSTDSIVKKPTLTDKSKVSTRRALGELSSNKLNSRNVVSNNSNTPKHSLLPQKSSKSNPVLVFNEIHSDSCNESSSIHLDDMKCTRKHKNNLDDPYDIVQIYADQSLKKLKNIGPRKNHFKLKPTMSIFEDENSNSLQRDIQIYEETHFQDITKYLQQQQEKDNDDDDVTFHNSYHISSSSFTTSIATTEQSYHDFISIPLIPLPQLNTLSLPIESENELNEEVIGITTTTSTTASTTTATTACIISNDQIFDTENNQVRLTTNSSI